MNQPPTTAGTWAPDHDATIDRALDMLSRVIGKTPPSTETIASVSVDVAIAEYNEQAAAAGLVMVRRDFLAQTKEMVDWLMGTCTAMGSDQAVYDELVALAATPEPTPGGDAG